MTQKILVTGATGTVGREVVPRLAASGVQVRAACRHPEMLALPEDYVEAVVMNLRDPAELDRALEDIEKIFYLSPLDETMVEDAALMVERARAHGVRHLVRLSALGVDHPRKITLGKVHGEVERIIRGSGIDCTFLRPNSFMQNFITYWSESIRRQNAFYIPQGQGRVSIIDSRDIADVAAAVLTQDGHAGKVYELTGPEALSNFDIARVLSDVLGREISYRDIPVDDARSALTGQGMSEWMVRVILELFEMSKADDAAQVNDTVEQLIGRAPIRFDAFVRDFSHAFR
ncbi:MAG: SDR family oxidoreductase [Gammaproteobacteria bacterium]|nr:SDR family oxidoreductase [Gammaproteobacteria bacterium]